MPDHEIEIQTSSTDRPFAEGDVVQLKSGGQAATFREYTETGKARVMCSTPSGFKYETLPVKMLRFARDDAKHGEGN